MRVLNIILLASFFLLLQTGCGGGISGLAESILYPLESVNKASVPDTPPAGFAEVWFDAKATDGTDMKIHSWFHRTNNANAKVIVYHHGNAMHLGRLASSTLLELMTRLNAHVVVYDYPAYGKSTGFPNEANLQASAQAALNFAKSKFPGSPLVVWGRSMGAAVAARLTRNNETSVAGLVLTSPWANFYALALHKTGLAKSLPKEWVEAHKYDSVDAVSTLATVTLIHHGIIDKVIPMFFGRQVFAAFPDLGQVAWREVSGFGHNDIFNNPTYWQDIKSFVR